VPRSVYPQHAAPELQHRSGQPQRLRQHGLDQAADDVAAAARRKGNYELYLSKGGAPAMNQHQSAEYNGRQQPEHGTFPRMERFSRAPWPKARKDRSAEST
jgi:hypothetical protein